MTTCVFCQIAGGGVPAGIVFEDDQTLAFLDHRPVFPGHCLLIPRQHLSSLVDIPAPLLAQLAANAKLLAIAVEKGLGAQGAFVAINNRVSQSVPHMHVHVVPRTKGDGLKGFFWPRQKYRDPEHVEEVRAGLVQAIRATLDDCSVS
jgi:histidine triad (HIT) family protein